MKLATLPTLRIVFEPADFEIVCNDCKRVFKEDEPKARMVEIPKEGIAHVAAFAMEYVCPDCGIPVREVATSVGRIAEAWDKPFAEDPDWDPYDTRFAAQRIARDGLQPELLAVAEDV